MDTSSNIEEIEGELEASVKFASKRLFEASANTEFDLTDDDDEFVNDVYVNYYGNFIPSTVPTTFEAALRVCRDISQQAASHNFIGVPQKAFLLPLNRLDPDGVFTIIRDISNSMVRQLTEALQDMEEIKTTIDILSKSNAARNFNYFRRKIYRVLNALLQFEVGFKGQVASLLPRIRGRGVAESELAHLLRRYFASPFNKGRLLGILGNYGFERAVLQSFHQRLQSVTFCKDESEYILKTMTNDVVISLNLYLIDSDQDLDVMEAYNEGSQNLNVRTVHHWYRNQTTLSMIRHAIIGDLMNYKEVNSQSGIVFIYVPLTSASSYVYAETKLFDSRQRSRVDEIITLPYSPPMDLSEVETDVSVILSWSPPQGGGQFLTSYDIEITERGIREEQNPVKYIFTTTETSYTIIQPDISVPYNVTVKGNCKAGHTLVSEVLHHSGVKARIVGGAEVCSPRKAYTGRVEVMIISYESWNLNIKIAFLGKGKAILFFFVPQAFLYYSLSNRIV